MKNPVKITLLIISLCLGLAFLATFVVTKHEPETDQKIDSLKVERDSLKLEGDSLKAASDSLKKKPN
jgi:hypothetical protein